MVVYGSLNDESNGDALSLFAGDELNFNFDPTDPTATPDAPSCSTAILACARGERWERRRRRLLRVVSAVPSEKLCTRSLGRGPDTRRQ